MDQKEARRIPRAVQICLACAIQAVQDAGLPETMPDPERSGVIFGTVLAGIDLLDEGTQTMRVKGLGRVNPFTIPFGIPNAPAFLIAHRF